MGRGYLISLKRWIARANSLSIIFDTHQSLCISKWMDEGEWDGMRIGGIDG